MLEDLPKVTRLSTRIIRILGLNPSTHTLQGTNTYLVGTGNKRILIDTGEGNSSYEKLLSSVIQKENVTISTVLLSHWHHDHTGGLNVNNKFCFYPSSSVLKYPSFELLPFPYEHLYDNQVFQLTDENGGIDTTLIVKHTPGHTSDHCSFYLVEETCLFSGDCILGSGSSTVFENLSDYMKSLEKLESMNNPKIKTIYPGHGSCIINNGYETICDYKQHRIDRENQIIRLISNVNDDIGIDEIVSNVYSKFSNELQMIAKGSIKKHLDKLLDDEIIMLGENGKYKLTSST